MDNESQYKFRVSYEIPPTRAVHTAEFVEMAMGTEEIKAMVKAENPSWRILKIERGIKE